MMLCTVLSGLLALSYLIFSLVTFQGLIFKFCGQDTIISPLLHMRKLRIIVIKQLVKTQKAKVAT